MYHERPGRPETRSNWPRTWENAKRAYASTGDLTLGEALMQVRFLPVPSRGSQAIRGQLGTVRGYDHT